MTYIDIHTHRKEEKQKNIFSLFNLNVSDYFCRCGLDLLNLYYSLGIHPWKINSQLLSQNLRYIEDNGSFNKIKAIGECGLDRLASTPWELQIRAFIAQINISEKLQKPLIIHCVKAFDELIALKKEIKPQQAWIIHGFRGKPQQMSQLTKLGFYLSFGKYYNRETVRQISREQMFLETDDSELSIIPVYEKIADILGEDLQDIQNTIESNYNKVFN